MRLEPDSFPTRTLRRRAKLHIPAPTASFKVKTVLITGASGGICSEAARILIHLGAERLIFGVRNLDKGKKLAEELTRDFKDGDAPEILVWSLELKSLARVREFAQKAASLPQLDNVIIGAATALNERKYPRKAGRRINHFSNALLTILLLPTLASSAEKYKIKQALTKISSWSIQSSGFFAKKWWKWPRIWTLEDCISLFRELCDQLDKGIDGREGSTIINSVDPGTASTYLTELFMAKGPQSLFLKDIRRPTEHCARTVVKACIPRLETHGKLIVDLLVSMYMEKPNGRQVQTGFWEETKAALQKFSPGVSLYFDDIEAVRYPTPSQREGHVDLSIQDSVVTEGNLETPES